MGWFVIQRAGAKLAVRSGGLVVMVEDVITHRVKLESVDVLTVIGAVELSASARALLSSQGKDVDFFDGRGQWTGTLITREGSTARRRLSQYALLCDPEHRLKLARAITRGKLHNQRVLLRRLRQNSASDTQELEGAMLAIRRMMARLSEATDCEQLMGMEGHAAAMYYRGLGAAIAHPAFTFERRTRRPPRDPFNACLSFGYAMLLGRIKSAVRKAGLDVWLGALHSPGSNKPCLALDLMEEWRPFIDRVVMRLVNRRQLSRTDFMDPRWSEDLLSHPELDTSQDDAQGPPVWLNETGRAVLLKELAGLWRERVMYASRGAVFELGSIMDYQAQLLARGIDAGELELYQPVELT